MKGKDYILTLAREIPIFTTEQAARFFCKNGSPSKRASEALKSLEREKLIEGRRREIGKTKVWRLSAAGRELCQVKRAPVPFNSPKLEHIIEIGNIFLELLDSGRLAYFHYEPKDSFVEAGRSYIYCPDAFFVLKAPYRAFLLEVQRCPLSSGRWAAKWAIASAFFEEAYKGACWQVAKGKILKPKILVVSSQEESTIKAGSMLNMTISKSARSLL